MAKTAEKGMESYTRIPLHTKLPAEIPIFLSSSRIHL